MFLTPWLSRLRRHERRTLSTQIQRYEPRCLLAVFTVNSIGSEGDAYLEDDIPDIAGRPAGVLGPDDPGVPYSGIVTWSAAIATAEHIEGRDTIRFNIPGDGVHRILDAGVELDSLVIDGTTQPGYSGTPLIEIGSPTSAFKTIVRLTDNSVVKGLALLKTNVILEGDNNQISDNYFGLTGNGQATLKTSAEAVTIFGDENIVSDNVFGNLQAAIVVRGITTTNDNIIRNNFIGTDPTGAIAMPNDFGIAMADLTFGSTKRINRTLIENNLIANSTFDGLQVSGNANVVRNNVIGTNLAQTAAMGNSRDGINLEHFDNLIENNVIVASGRDGLRVRGSGEDINATLRNNFIGTTAAGAQLGNTGSGIEVFSVGAVLIEQNTIAFNGGAGVSLGGSPVAVAKILENSIHSNGALGIDYSTQFDTDGHGGDGLPNRPPVNLAFSVENGRFLATGEFFQAGLPLRLDLYDSDAADPSGFGEGQRHLATFEFNVNPDGTVTLDEPFNFLFSNLTATITDAEDTSEFSQVIQPFAIVVNTTSDQSDQNLDPNIIDVDPLIAGNQISLRAAIEFANQHSGPDTILFDIPTANPIGSVVITPFSQLPTITDSIIIDGTSQPGFGGAVPVRPLILIDGTFAGSANAIVVAAGQCRIAGLSVFSFLGDGIQLRSDDNRIENCFLGTQRGSLDDPILRRQQHGVLIDQSSRNEIRNCLISGNVIGVDVNGSAAQDNVIVGSLIGTDLFGAKALAYEDDPTGQSGIEGTFPTGNSQFGIRINSASNNRVGGLTASDRNVISGNRLAGIQIQNGANNNAVLGNFIGISKSGFYVPQFGLLAVGNGDGIVIDRASDNVIGGSTSEARNVISDNRRAGIKLVSMATENRVQGNYIGVNANGQIHNQDAGGIGSNGNGIEIRGSFRNLIGGSQSGEGNVISGNDEAGVLLVAGSNENRIQQNVIGLAANEFDAAPNDDGIRIELGSWNWIGGIGAGEGNHIARNGFIPFSGNGDPRFGSGVRVIGGEGNAILGNSIHDNRYLGISLSTAFVYPQVTPNDADDSDLGPNNHQNFPEIVTLPELGGTFGRLMSTPNASFRIEFFANPSAFSDDKMEGQNFLGAATVSTNGDGIATFSIDTSVLRLTMTATRIDDEGNFTDTSEFSLPLPPDTDDDGIPNDVEQFGLHNGDGNQDGIPDHQQRHVITFQLVGGNPITFATASGQSLQSVQEIANPSPTDAPSDADFGIGFFDFQVAGLTLGAATTVDLFLPDGLTSSAYYKFGTTPDNALPHWYLFDFDGTTGAEFLDGGRRVRLHFVDGGRGDDDLTANGVIVDPGAPDVEPEFNPVSLTLAAANANTRLQVNSTTGNVELVNAATNAVLLDLTADGVTQLTLNGGREDNRLTVDFTNGNPLPNDGLFFNGGRQRKHDDLVLTGGSFDSVTHTFANRHDGTVTIDGATITYTGLEPITDNLTAVERVFEFATTDDSITLTDAARATNGRLKLTSVRSSESVEFAAPAGSLTIRSGAGNDRVTVRSLDGLFVASNAAIVIEGGDGDDTLSASRVSKAVSLDGGVGRDSLHGGLANDMLEGGNDRDYLYGNRGNDTLSGDSGNDHLQGGDGDDSLSGGDGNDSIRGDAGNDRLFGDSGNDTLHGHSGNDTVLGGEEHDSLTGGSGADLLAGQSGRDSLKGDSGSDTLFGGTDNDSLRGGEGNDVLLGEEGDDKLFGDGGSSDTLNGGDDNDSLVGTLEEIDETFLLELDDLLN